MTQRQVQLRDAGHGLLDELDATDIPALAYEATGAVTTHAGAADPHADRSFATSAVSTHAGAADPHTGYALESALGSLATQSGTFSGTSSGTNTGDQTLPVGGTPAIVLGTAASAGSSPNFLRRDDTILAFDATAPVTQASADAAAAGSATVAARRDHKHGMPTIYVPGGTDVAVADGGTGASDALTARANLGAASSVIRGLLPTGALYHSFPRQNPAGNLGLLATGRLSIAMIEMDAGVTLTSITFLSGTTALTVGVNQWFALFDSSRVPLRVTVDGTSGAWAANTEKPLALSSTFLTTYSGIYFVGIMVKATTVPSLIAATGNANVNAVTLPITGGNSTSGLTDPASCPNPAGAIAGGVGFPYFYVS